MDKILAAQPLKVPTMLVNSLWDQEDIYGAMAVYKAIKAKDTGKRQSVSSPWALASRAGDRRWQFARRAEIRERYRLVFSQRDSGGRSWRNI